MPGNNLFLKALAAFLVLPGFVAGVLPALLSQIEVFAGTGSALGWPVLLAGVVILLCCVRDFYVAGKGTLAPWSPPEKLVTGGLYRFSRNPMYVGVLNIIAGWALLFGSLILAIYGAVVFFAFHLRVVFHEEPWQEKTFGAEWSKYVTRVNRWLPRVGK